MKRYVAFFLSILLLFTLPACGGQPAADSSSDTKTPGTETPNSQSSEKDDKKLPITKDPGQSGQQTSEQATNPDLAYSELVERFRTLVSDPFGQDSDKPGEMGFLETARGMGDSAAEEMGYLIQDLSGDGVPELAVGGLYGMINALYTLVDGEPELVFEGWHRSSYVYMGDGRFYYYCSNGAAENGQGVFNFTKDGTKLKCESFLFTGLNSDGDVVVYSNETGSWDIAESEKSDMTAEDFWAMDSLGEPLPLTPFSGTDGWSVVESESPVSVQYLVEVGNEGYDWVTLYDSSDACCILITSDSRISNVNIWNLFTEDVADDGTVTCSITLAGDDCHWDTVTPDTPIAVQLIFPGDLPAYGISYQDQHGTLHCFAIEVSGNDGALLLREADPNEDEFVLHAEW